VTASFSKRIIYLKNITSRIGEGNLEIQSKISSKDELCDLARSIDDMRLGLKDRNDLLDSLLNTFKGRFGNLAMIIVRKDIEKLISRNPRIKEILPESPARSQKKAKNIKKMR
jgi:methyl-accepting chemotaxis protein